MINELMTLQKKNGRTWETIRTTDDAPEIHESLMHDLIAKKLEQCAYIKFIKRVQTYRGVVDITVTYSNDVRRIYTVTSH